MDRPCSLIIALFFSTLPIPDCTSRRRWHGKPAAFCFLPFAYCLRWSPAAPSHGR